VETISVDEEVIELQYQIENTLKNKIYDIVFLTECFEKLIEVEPQNIEYLFSFTKKLQKKKENALASQLLLALYERFKDSFKERNLSRHLLKLLKLTFLYSPHRKELKDDILEAYRQTYHERENLEHYIEKSQIEDEGNLSEAINRLDIYLTFDKGSYVLQETFGIGQVLRVDLESDRFILDFFGKVDPKTNKILQPGKKGHAVTARMLPQFVVPLDPQSFRLQCHLDLEKIKQLSKEDPVSILRLVLNDFANRMNLKQLKATLIPHIIPTSKWSSWWKDLRTQIQEDPYFTIGEGPSALIEVLEIARSHDDSYITKFRAGKNITEMLEEARNIIQNTSNAGAHFKQEVLRICELYKNKPETSLPQQVELLLFLKENEDFFPIDVECNIALYLTTPQLAQEVIEGVHIEEYQQTLLKLYQHFHPNAYLDFFAEALFFTQRKNWEFLWKQFKNHPDIANNLIARLDANNDAYPNQYQWLAKNVFERRFEKFQVPSDIRIFENLLRLLGKLAILNSNTSDKEELLAVRKSLASLKSILTYKDSFYIQRYIEKAAPHEVAYFDQLLHTKIAVSESLRATLSKHVVKRLSVEASTSSYRPSLTVQPEEDVLYVTEVSLQRKKEEYQKIVKELIPQTIIEIGVAREHGDLSENAEYDAAQEKLARLREREQRLGFELNNSRLIDFNEITGKTVTVGTQVTLEDTDTEEQSIFTLLGAWDGDEENNIISYKSPFAQNLIGKVVGTEGSFALENTSKPFNYKIIKIEVTSAPKK
jgi:transcription elongation factor GreA